MRPSGVVDPVEIVKQSLPADLVEDRALVSIRPGDDARSRMVAITAKGHGALAGAYAAWRKTQDRLTETIGAQAADGLRRLARATRA